MNRRYNILAGVLLFATASPLWGAESPDLDGVTMEVLRQNDPREITHDIQLPHAIEKQGERHTRPNRNRAEDERRGRQQEQNSERREPSRDRNEENEERRERSEESKEQAEESKEQAEESKEQAEDDKE